ncbi:hypothetical protein JTE90_003137 [Oedothorax gibbosus]|uniref:Uncharacterized protein n=1 Tax=Oedothorax gibbosus TaxID=931172 RepID=A0AAV6VD94_9ARAC|nr:hypothetical protein JTE90_003137 [Oedothorax gibbosus]
MLQVSLLPVQYLRKGQYLRQPCSTHPYWQRSLTEERACDEPIPLTFLVFLPPCFQHEVRSTLSEDLPGVRMIKQTYAEETIQEIRPYVEKVA